MCIECCLIGLDDDIHEERAQVFRRYLDFIDFDVVLFVEVQDGALYLFLQSLH
jgi:hypothetical protein